MLTQPAFHEFEIFCVNIASCFSAFSSFSLSLLKCLHYYFALLPENVSKNIINPFLTNVRLTDKPGSWFLIEKCLKNTCERVTF